MAQQYEIEPNNLPANANVLQTVGIIGQILSSYDVDYFKYVTTGPGTVTFLWNLDGSGNTVNIKFFDKDLNRLYWFTQNYSGSHAVSTLAAQTFYFSLDSDYLVNYTVATTFSNTITTEIENNNTPTTANLINSVGLTGVTWNSTDVDYFKYVTYGSGTTTFYWNIDWSYSGESVNIKIFDTALNQIYSTSQNTNGSYSVSSLEAKNYYISIDSPNYAYYTVAAAYVKEITREIETNDSFSSATEIYTAGVKGDFKSKSLDVDYYKVYVGGIGTATFYINLPVGNTVPVNLKIYDSNKVLQRTYSPTANSNFSISTIDEGYVYLALDSSTFKSDYTIASVVWVSQLVKSYKISANSAFVDEGGTAKFTITTKNVPSGTVLDYQLSGVSLNDITGGKLLGSTVVDSNGLAYVNVVMENDNLTEGNETLTIQLQGQSSSVTISDTSRSKVFTLLPLSKSINEGETAKFSLSTDNVSPGTVVDYVISGVTSEDIVGGKLFGSLVIDSSGKSALDFPTVIDGVVESTENIVLTVQGSSALILLNDVYSLPWVSLKSGKYFYSTSGADKATGTSYIDVIKESSAFSANQITKLTDGSWQVQNKITPSNSDNLVSIERIEFSDLSVALDLAGSAGQVAKILGSVFGKSYISNTLFAGIGLAYMDGGMSYKDLSGLAAGAAGLSTADVLVTTMLRNVTGVEPTATSKAPYLKLLTDGASFSDVVMQISDLAVNSQNIKLTDLANSGLAYTPYVFPATPTYSISATSSSVNEGASATFNLTTTNVAAGTEISYSLSGVTTADLTSGSLLGKVIVNASGITAISIPIAADLLTEGAETLVLSTQGLSASLTINDNSKSGISPTYALSATAASIKEGEIARFNVSTTNVSTGTALQYSVVGVTTGDIVGGLTRTVVVDATGKAVIDIATLEDNLVEGNETMTVVLGNAQASITIVDVILVGVPDSVGDGG